MTPSIDRLSAKTVVIVGGGLVAGLVSRQLTDRNIDVVVLERGGDHARSAATTLPNQRDELRWDVHQGLVQDWGIETYTLRHRRGETALPARWMEAFIPGTGLGGAGNHWNGQTWRWSEYEPELRSRLEGRYGKSAIPKDVPLQDWGTTYAEMRPYHELFEKLFGISGKAGNINGVIHEGGNPYEAPRDGDFPQRPLETTEAGLVFKATAERLGYRPFPTPAANSSGAYTNPDGQKLGACQYCGHCERFICEARAKGSPDTLLYPMLAKRKTFEARLHCQVTELIYDAHARRVTGVRYVDLLSGKVHEQPAEVVVLGAFTMTNTKLLLTSGIGKPYDPVSNAGVVGRNFCYQAGTGVAFFMKDRWFNPFLSTGSSQMALDEFNNDNFDHSGLGFLGGAVIGCSTYGRPIGNRHVPPDTPRWGSAWKRANADWYAHSATFFAQGSCYPHRDNYLDLDPTYRDAYGQPLVRMNFDWRENEQRMSAFVTRKIVELASATGADIVAPANALRVPFDTRYYASTHIAGGTPMGSDPATSVVSPHLQHWDCPNLFVVGASVFAHNAGHNPTGPVAALALRAGDDVADFIRRPRMLS